MNLYSGQLLVAIKAKSQDAAEAIFDLAYGKPAHTHPLATMEVVEFDVICVEDDVPPYEYAVGMFNELGDSRTITLYAENYSDALNQAERLAAENNPPAMWPAGLPPGTWKAINVDRTEEPESEDDPD